MKSLIAVFSIVLVAFFTAPAAAQQSDHHPDQGQAMQAGTTAGMMSGKGMMEGGMMSGMMGGQATKGKCPMCGKMMKGGMMGGRGMMSGGMMGGEMHRFMRAIYHLPELKAKLDLSDDQVSQLKELQTAFLKSKADWKANIEKKRIDLDNQLDNKAAASEVRKTLQAISGIKVDLKVAGYETAQKMISILTSEQKELWENFCCMGGQQMHKGMMKGGMMGNPQN